MRFKQWLLNEEDNIHTIYCDMDGVLTDLVGKLAELSGQQFSSNGEAMRALVRMRKNNPEAIESPFWASLNWTPNGKKVWEFIKPFNPFILTGGVKGSGAEKGKQEWVERELGLPPNRVFVTHQKYTHANPNAILIDDTPHQINNWTKHGGIGILHSDANFQDTLRQLNEIF
jgi:5'(3')-deoxyribonucleotidase